jgi:hypothetical protein
MSQYLDNLIDYKVITLYPILTYLFFKFCGACYNVSYNSDEFKLYNTDDDLGPNQINKSIKEEDDDDEIYYHFVVNA